MPVQVRGAGSAAVSQHAYLGVTHQNAICCLCRWEEQVTLVSADMRTWQAPQAADILVSELLGSFGDNELSPECLDGAQRFLHPRGVSIPCAYTNHLQPVTSSKLWADVKVRGLR